VELLDIEGDAFRAAHLTPQSKSYSFAFAGAYGNLLFPRVTTQGLIEH
jgi:hypothetical protein